MDSKGPLTHVEPCARPFQPKPGQVEAGADRREHELITWIAVVTIGIGGGVVQRGES